MRPLLSFHYFRTYDLRNFDGLELFADSGAFSAMTSGKPIDVDHYARWILKWRHRLTHYVNLDVIGDHQGTAANQAILEQRHGLTPVPVFHVNSPMSELEALCERHEYVAIGGMVAHKRDLRSLFDWCIGVHRVADRYDTRLHAFGQTNIDVLRDLPWYSADSATWVAGVMNGKVMFWDPRAAAIRGVFIGKNLNRTLVAADRELLAAQLPCPVSDLLDPKFSGPSRALTHEELKLRRYQYYEVILQATLRAHVHFEHYLRQRHGELRLRDSGESGFNLYVAAGNTAGQIEMITRVIKETRQPV